MVFKEWFSEANKPTRKGGRQQRVEPSGFGFPSGPMSRRCCGREAEGRGGIWVAPGGGGKKESATWRPVPMRSWGDLLLSLGSHTTRIVGRRGRDLRVGEKYLASGEGSASTWTAAGKILIVTTKTYHALSGGDRSISEIA